MDAVYLMSVGTLVLIYILMTLGFNLAVGYTGLVNFGHVGLMGAGAYASAYLTKTEDVPVLLGILIGGAVGALLGALLALPSKKIRGDYYALVTLGFMFVAQAVFINWESVTRGTLGLPGVPRPSLFPQNPDYFLLTLIVTGIIFYLLYRLVRSPFGRVLEAVRDDEEVAEALGKPAFKLKIISLALSGAVVGIAGALLAHYVQFISPNQFWLDLLVWALAGMMVGGTASMRGSVVGIVILFVIWEGLRFVAIPSDIVGPVRLIILEVAILLVLLYRPKGLLGRAQLES